MTIYKYRLHAFEQQVIAMPSGASPLTVQVQGGVPHLWALVDPSQTAVDLVDIRMYGTGRLFDVAGLNYIATYQLDGGALVFHVFRALA